MRVAGRGYRDGVRNLEVMVESLSGGGRPEIQEEGRVMATPSYSRPRKGTSVGGTACFGVFCVKIRPGPLAVASCKNPKKTNTFLVRKVTHAQKRYAWADRDERLHRCRGP